MTEQAGESEPCGLMVGVGGIVQTYRPTLGWYLVNSLGAVIVLGAGALWAVLAFSRGDTAEGVLAVAAPVVVAGIWVVRLTRVRISFDSDTLRLAGPIHTVSLPRESIRSVRTDIRRAAVVWERPDGSLRTTPLTAIAVRESSFAASRLLRRQREFLDELAAWAQPERPATAVDD